MSKQCFRALYNASPQEQLPILAFGLHSNRDITMMLSDLLNFGGVTLCGLVGVKMFTSAADSLQRYASGRKRFRLKNAALRQELDRLRRVALSTGETTAWEGWRKFRVHSKVQESETCHSIYFVPHDGKPLPQYHPGQFLTFSVRIPGQEKPIVRCYSLSDSPNSVFYRCSVKKVPATFRRIPAGTSKQLLQ